MYSKTSFYFLLCCCVLFSCRGQQEREKQPDKGFDQIAPAEANPQPPVFDTEKLEVKTFEVMDTLSGKSLGWGYDIFMDGRLAIHQPILPGVPGNKSFTTEEKAKKTGAFAVEKMKQSGGLPTITIEELNSLGIN